MITKSLSFRPRPRPGCTRRNSSSPRAASRRTSRSTSLSTVLRGDAKLASGRPVFSSRARAAAAELNCPKARDMPLNRATMSPAVRGSIVTWLLSRAESIAGGDCRRLFFRGARTIGASGLGMKRIEIALRHRPVNPSQLDRHVVKPARREAAIEMPQPRNDHARDRDLDVGPGLVEHKEVEAFALDEIHTGHHLLALIEDPELGAEVRLH